METIAPEQVADPGPPGDPYRIVEVESAPKYDDTVKTVKVPARWLPIAEQLVAAGKDRKFYSSARGKSGNQLLHAAWGAIRRIWAEEANPAGMTQAMAAELVGVSRAQLHTILNSGEK